MTKEVIKWTEYEELEFFNEKFNTIDLTSLKLSKNLYFNTKLTFQNCIIDNIVDTIKTYSQKLTFLNCEIGQLWFLGTSFSGGLEIKNCLINEPSQFHAIRHNLDPNEFVIDNCVFKGYVDFFDCYFEGPVKIYNNNFQQGTNLGIYLQRPFGIKDKIEFKISNNIGDLFKNADNDEYRK